MNFSVTPSSNAIAISFRDLTLGYDRHPAVHHLNGEIRQGELLGLMGPNGAGKSTLLKGIIGQLRPLDGTIQVNGAQARGIAYLPQQVDVDRSFPINVFDCVAMGLWHDIGIWHGVGEDRRSAVVDALAGDKTLLYRRIALIMDHAAMFLHSVEQAAQASAHALHATCLSACLRHSVSQS
jgi:ABC-type Mn2+/Zn2+ transport system ATPase subunit